MQPETLEIQTEEITHEDAAQEEITDEGQEEEILDDSEVLEDEELEGEETEPVEEIDYEGRKYTLPKSIKEAVMRHADYTRKTQDLASQRKELDNQQKQVAQYLQNQQGLMQETAQVLAIDQNIEQYNQLDWNSLIAEDPVKAQQLQMQLSQLKDTRQRLAGEIAQKNEQLNLEAQQNLAKQIEQNESVLASEIKDWSPELDNKLQDFAVNKMGFDSKDAQNAKADIRLIKLLHLAHIGSQLLEKQAQPRKPAQQIKPVTMVTTRSSKAGVKNPSKMTPKEFAQWRHRHIKNR